jgi:hypothetical protein
MLLDPDEIPELIAEVPELASIHAELDGGIRVFRADSV